MRFYIQCDEMIIIKRLRKIMDPLIDFILFSVFLFVAPCNLLILLLYIVYCFCFGTYFKIFSKLIIIILVSLSVVKPVFHHFWLDGYGFFKSNLFIKPFKSSFTNIKKNTFIQLKFQNARQIAQRNLWDSQTFLTHRCTQYAIIFISAFFVHHFKDRQT